MVSPIVQERSPVHVVYGGAHRYKYDTPLKLGSIAVANLHSYAPNALELSKALGISGSTELIENVYERTCLKLETEPVEDFRIDFEDGYGVRPDNEEDAHAEAAAVELARVRGPSDREVLVDRSVEVRRRRPQHRRQGSFVVRAPRADRARLALPLVAVRHRAPLCAGTW